MRIWRLVMKSLGLRTGSLVAPVVLLVALSYSQVGWRRDQRSYVELIEQLNRSRLQASFPSDGQDLAASALRVIREIDTVSLARIVRGRSAVIYFERTDCFICARFAVSMDSLLPAWRDSLIVVRPRNDEHASGAFMLDSISSVILKGVPAMLVVDSTGVVRHSVPAGLPGVISVLEFVGIPAPRSMLFERVTDSTAAAGDNPRATGWQGDDSR